MTLYNEYSYLINLICAALFGMLLGINRALNHKPAGLRTHALVALGAALAVVTINQFAPQHTDAASRVMQGIITGIGFIGAGVIIHHDANHRVEGLTTASSIWMSSMIGLACGSGLLLTAGVTLLLTLLLLTLGLWLEKQITRLSGHPCQFESDSKRSSPNNTA